MKISISDMDFRYKFGEEGALKLLSESGFDGVDYAICTPSGGVIDLTNHVEKAKETKKLLDKHSLEVYQSHSHWQYEFSDEFSDKTPWFDNLIKSIEFASIIGAKIIVIHALKVPLGVDFLEVNLRFYKALEPVAKKFGVKIGVENLLNSIFWTGRKLNQFLRILDSDVFTACVDVGHSAIVGVEPENFINEIDEELLGCVHIQDTDGKNDKHWVPFDGVHNWEEITKALGKKNFSGFLNLESAGGFRKLPLELHKDKLKFTAIVSKYLAEKVEEYKKG